MHMRGKQYLICLRLPLKLATMTPLKSLFAHSLGQAVLTHAKTLQNKGFLPTIIYLDAQKGFLPLAQNIPGLEVDIAGAGDHNNPAH